MTSYLPKLSLLPLFVLAIIPLFLGFHLDFWEVFRLAAISICLGWVLLRRRYLIERQGHRIYSILLPFFVSVFVVCQFGNPHSSNLSWYLVRGTAFVSAIGLLTTISLCSKRELVVPFSRMDKLVLGSIGGILLFSVFSFLFPIDHAVGPESLPQWRSALDIFLTGLLYFGFSRFPWNGDSRSFSVTSLLGLNAAVLVVVSASGLYRIAVASYLGDHVSASFGHRQYSETRAYWRRLQELNNTLGIQRYTFENVATDLANVADSPQQPAEMFVELGDMNAEAEKWNAAVSMYNKALSKEPYAHEVYRKLGDAFLQLAAWHLAADAYSNNLKVEPSNIRANWGLSVALSKQVNWPDTNRVLDELLLRNVKSLGPKMDGNTVLRLADLVGEDGLSYLSKLSLYECTLLLANRGWQVFRNPMEIGGTNVFAPCDAFVYSAGGGNYTGERIEVNGVNVSPQERGYNLVRLDPKTGEVTARANFDIWGDREKGPLRFAEYIDDIKDGEIVILTIRDDAGQFLTDRGIEALRKVGAIGVPGPWWSHAIIGVKGALPGTALEAVSGTDHVNLGILKGNSDASTEEEQKKLLVNSLSDSSEVSVAVFLSKPLQKSLVALRSTKGPF